MGEEIRKNVSIYYDKAREEIDRLFKEEFPEINDENLFRLIGFLYQTTKYKEEDLLVKPTIFITNNINQIVKQISDSSKIAMFKDNNLEMLRARLKSLACFAANNWIIYINYASDETVEYGIIKKFSSIKDEPLLKSILSNEQLKEKGVKFIRVSAVGDSGLIFSGINGSVLNISLNFLGVDTDGSFDIEIENFIDAALGKVVTSSKKRLREIKNIYKNIFSRIFQKSHGSICLIADKDNDLRNTFKDAVWLPTPIEFYKLFTQKKNFSEYKLSSYSELLDTMLNYDGITVIDNGGRILGYNLFIQSSASADDKIIGGARIRAANTLISMNNKGIIGVYFQSQNGYNFFRFGKAYKPKKKRNVVEKQTIVADPVPEEKPIEIVIVQEIVESVQEKQETPQTEENKKENSN